MKLHWPTLLMTLGLAAALVWAVLSAAIPDTSLAHAAAQSLAQSDIHHPVTAVLLSFRSYDTLLEVAVLLVAVLGALAVCPPRRSYEPGAPNRAQASLVSVIVPVGVLIGGYLLWAGSYRPGGAFQAGAVLGATAVMMHLSGMLNVALSGLFWRIGFAAGLAVFLAVGAAALFAGRAWLEYSPDAIHLSVVSIEAALSISIALTLYALFAMGVSADEPAGGARAPERR